MYAHGIYRFTGHFLDCMYEEWDLDMFSNTEVALDEILGPLNQVIEDVNEGRLPVYVAREVFKQRLEVIENGPYPALNYLPEWDDFMLDGRLAEDIWCEEEPLWTILVNSEPASHWASLYPKPGTEHGFDPEIIIKEGLNRDESIFFIALVDWESGTLTIYKSTFVGNRKYLFSDVADAEEKGEVETYVLPPSMEESVFKVAVESYRVIHSWEDRQPPDDEQILRDIEDEYGYIPGSLPSQNIGVPHNSRTHRLAESHPVAY